MKVASVAIAISIEWYGALRDGQKTSGASLTCVFDIVLEQYFRKQTVCRRLCLSKWRRIWDFTQQKDNNRLRQTNCHCSTIRQSTRATVWSRFESSTWKPAPGVPAV